VLGWSEFKAERQQVISQGGQTQQAGESGNGSGVKKTRPAGNENAGWEAKKKG